MAETAQSFTQTGKTISFATEWRKRKVGKLERKGCLGYVKAG